MTRPGPDYDELLIEHHQHRTYRARRCLFCLKAATWHVTNDETDEVVWVCDYHKGTAFS